jgi:hypothetical protein
LILFDDGQGCANVPLAAEIDLQMIMKRCRHILARLPSAIIHPATAMLIRVVSRANMTEYSDPAFVRTISRLDMTDCVGRGQQPGRRALR